MISTSTIEAKYVILRNAAREVIWIRQFINKFEFETIKSLTLYGNNEINITFTKNVDSQHYTKHIDIQHHYIRELVNK